MTPIQRNWEGGGEMLDTITHGERKKKKRKKLEVGNNNYALRGGVG